MDDAMKSWGWLVLLWPSGFAVLKLLAAREAADHDAWETLSRLVWLDWARGRSLKARLLATAAWAWFIGGFLILVTAAIIYSLRRR